MTATTAAVADADEGRFRPDTARVVVVDDVTANVDLLHRILTRAGLAQVDGFTDPHEALAACTSEPPSLILLDLHMPELDGVTFLERLHSAIGNSGFVPVIVITADVNGDTRRHALEAGANDYLTKPFDVSEVLLRVRNMLETSRLYTQVRRHTDNLENEIKEQLAREAEADEHRRALMDRIESAMAPTGMTSVYQPVVGLSTNEIVGAEALARFTGPPQRPPNEWFDEAEEVGELTDLELRALEHALSGLDRLPPGSFMAINVSPTTAVSSKFAAVLAALPADRIVVELTEHNRVSDYATLMAHLEPFITRGGRIAVDDAGSGYAGLAHILRLHPQIIKLDAVLVTGIDADPARRALADSLVTFANEIGATIVAEGIETQAELDVLRELGVHWGQGFYLARPQTLPVRLDPAYEASVEE
ncbi:MAG TPA: EAL domain-containing protein [Mycobacteriales bacterium]|nr:EAL domain-containing protein [Mycobacteriales bacterium]